MGILCFESHTYYKHFAGNLVSIPLAGDRDMLELKLDTDDEDEDVFLLSVTLLF